MMRETSDCFAFIGNAADTATHKTNACRLCCRHVSIHSQNIKMPQHDNLHQWSYKFELPSNCTTIHSLEVRKIIVLLVHCILAVMVIQFFCYKQSQVREVFLTKMSDNCGFGIKINEFVWPLIHTSMIGPHMMILIWDRVSRESIEYRKSLPHPTMILNIFSELLPHPRHCRRGNQRHHHLQIHHHRPVSRKYPPLPESLSPPLP